MFEAHVLTLFPDMFPGALAESVTGRGLGDKWSLQAHNIRDYATDKHNSVDDTPYGGGAGMVMRADIVGRALDAVEARTHNLPKLCLSPRGEPWTQQRAQALSQKNGVILLCGRFEGIDARIFEHYDIEEVSIGDFVLTGGEIPAMALLDSVVRLLPNVLGSAESIEDESFTKGLLEYPHYTRPKDWRGLSVPDVLLSGNHKQIASWRQEQSENITQKKRPDLWCAHKKKQAQSEEAKQSDVIKTE
jgi:tRNA (guanine37-N1)-methyltransferase